MILRHHDYLLIVPTVPAGGIRDIPLQLDSDAPFKLRLVRSRNIGVSGWRFQTPKRLWESNGLRTDLVVPTVAGAGVFPSRGSIIYPEYTYPIGATIVCEIGNTTGEPISNAQLLFRGSKLYHDGAVFAPNYPPKMSLLPFIYPVEANGVALLGVAGAIQPDLQLRIKSDADFVYRYGVCDPFTLGVDGQAVGNAGTPGNLAGAQFSDVYVQLRDEARKAYSNVPIHVDDLFGQGLPSPSGAGADDDQVLNFPGLLSPEIYLPREHSLYFDVFRRDTSGSATVDLKFRFHGVKVFAR